MVVGRKLLVEGESDKRAIQEIGGLDLDNVEVLVAGGFPPLCRHIVQQIKAPMGMERLAIVFDANGNPEDQWGEVRKAILDGYSQLQPATQVVQDKLASEIPAVPTVTAAGGIWVDYKPWVTSYRSSLGLWMMPSNHEEGALEEFLVRIVDPNNPYWQPAQKYVKEVSDISQNYPLYKIFPGQKITKARIHAWLAIQESTGDPPGEAMAKAIRARAFDIQSNDAQNLKTWLAKLN